MRRTTTVVSGFILCALATPAFCSVIIDFSGPSTPPGTITVQASNDTLSGATALNAVPFSSVTISGAPQDNSTYAITGAGGTGVATLTYNASTDILSLSGEITGLGINTVTTLWSATVAPSNIGVTLYGSNQNVIVALNAATNISEAAILTALNVTYPNSSALASGSGVLGSGSGTASGGNYTFSSSSETLDTVVSATPEPVSFLLMGGGLLLVGGLTRKKRKV